MYKAKLLLKVSEISKDKITEIKSFTYVNQFIQAATLEAAQGDSISLYGHMKQAGEYLPRYLERIDPKTTILKSPEKRVTPFLRSQLFIALMAGIEDYFSQILKEILLSFPEKNNVKSVEKSQIMNSINKFELIEILTTKTLMNIFYAAPGDYRKEIERTISADSTLLEPYWSDYVEMKATRDTGMHGGWIANKVYIEKAREKARQSEGKLLPVTDDYFKKALEICEAMVKDIESNILDKYKINTYSYVFKEMWEKSSLNAVVPFENAWDIESDYMVRPKNGFTWGWSHSEKLLFDFFMSIYQGEDSMPPITKLYARLYKNDLDIISSWVSAPFFFGDIL